MKKLYTILLAFVLAAVSSCTYEFPVAPPLVPGTADFTKVVAVGNSLTAGYMNGALYNDGQAASYANIIAIQMQSNGGGAFNQPDIDAEHGDFGPSGGAFGRLFLRGELTAEGVVDPIPKPIKNVPGQPITEYAGDKTLLNNFGVPGMRVVDAAFSGYGPANPYFGRFASGFGATVLGDAIAANGTFIIFWLGNNDVLGYATSGATGNPNGDASDPSKTTDMISVDVFEEKYIDAITKLFTNDSKQGIIANIPNVQDLPFFTFIEWDAIPLDQATADLANAGYATFNGGINAYNAGLLPGQDPANPPTVKRDTIGFKAGQNAIVITDVTIPDLSAYAIPSIRQAKSTDLITLLAGSVLGTLADPPGNDPTLIIGVTVPLDEQYTLIEADQEAIADRIVAFNSTIKSVADDSGGSIALLDMNTVFADFAQNGVSINGSGMDASFTPGSGAFSVDGVHPNPRGAAYVASLFIDKINEAFGSNIPNVNPNNYPGNDMPQANQ